MANPPPLELTTDGAALIELDEEIDGDEVGSRNYRFCKVGEGVPIKSDDNSEFDPQCLPSQPLAVSERFRLLFIAHPQGFCVARTKDVMASAEEIKEKQTGPSVQELSLVDVSIGKVSILALSADDSLLAVTIDNHVHFFAVSALLHKDQKPSYSVSLDDSICIKDMRWARKVAKAYIILSDDGKLYHGSGQGPPSYVMEGVDSVDWSVKGNFVAVAKKNTVSILSSEFKEKLRFLLQFQSAVGDSDVNQVIKVDSIRWIRPDCIAVGCFQLNDDGEEENYIVQVITTRGRRITDVSAASKPIVLSFSNVFMDFSSDAVPVRDGPHLFLSYLDLYGLAFIANRNLSQHVGLFCWSLDSGKNEAAVIEILNDAWNLYIDSQANGEENVIMGLSVDKVSQNENVRFTLGDEEIEVSPCCVIVCLTIDGKISVFHFASARGALASSEVCASDEEEDDSQASTNHKLSVISSAGGEESRAPTSSPSESYEFSRVAIEKTGAKVTITNELSPSFHLDGRSQKQTSTENTGQKPLTNSQMVKVKVDEPEKALSTKQNQDSNPEYQSIPEVKRSTGFFSAEVVGDPSQQLMNNYPISGRNVDPIGKVPSTSSPSGWSLTRSNARIDSSKPSTGKFLSFPSGDIGNSDKPALQSGGGVERRPTDLKEKAKPSVSFTSFGQTDLSAQGNRNSLPGSPGTQVPLTESVASGKSFPSEFRKELSAAPSPAGLPYSAQKASKQFGNVEEMARKLDKLLEGIEGKGGFRDASITSQTRSVVELEDCIWALSDRCRTWRGLMDERLKEVQLLLDKTIQVLVRKVYMEGIFKQATDSRYWELWNRQKLSSEMELKRRRILELNQELTNKLIELERHFNSLEFNKFGEDGGMTRNRRVLQNSHRHSRQIQPLHILHNTMHAQLAAAEQLSGCLSKQMAALSIESSGKHDMKRQLFESIGLSYVGDTKTSPARTRTSITPSDQKHFITSGSIASKDQSRRNQASSAKSYEPETARRRRDSLERSWASFDPPKTTVRRMLKEDSEKGSANRSLFNMEKQYLSPQLHKKSEVSHSALLNLSGGVNHYQSKGTAEIPVKQSTQRPSSSSLPQRTAGLLDRGMQVSSTKQISALPPPSILETRTAHSSEVGVFKLIDEKSKSSLPFTGKNDSFAPNESKLVQRFDTSFHPLPSMSAQMPERSLTPPAGLTESLDHFKIGFTKSNTLNQKSTSMASDTTLFDSKVPITPASFNSGSNVSAKGLFTKNSDKPSQPYDGMSASTQLQSVSSSSLPSLSAFVSKPSSLTLSPVTPSSSGASVAAKEVPQPQTSVRSTLNFPSMLSSSTHEKNLSSISPSSSVKKPESLTSLSVPPIAKYGSETEGVLQAQTSFANVPSKIEEDVKIQASASQHGLAIATSDLKFGPLDSSAPTELSINSKSESKIDFGDSSKSSSVTSAIKLELPSATEALSPVALSSEGIGGSGKNVASESSHEEEMEEEAPETDQIAGFALGNFGGFGIGSTSNSTAPKPKPFGVAVLNKNTNSATSQYMAPASGGELFRPASFNFQPPQTPEPLGPPNVANFSGASGIPGQVSAGAGFGQPAHVGVGQQALGSVLGTFGQSRQLGTGLPGSTVASASGFGSGFAGIPAGGFGGGFASASSGGGFASLASGGGGFGAAATVGGGFAAAATAGGGFAGAASAGGGFGAAASAGGGFGAAASAGGGFGSSTSGAVSGVGFGAFSNQQGSGGGFSAFGGGSGTGRPPSELFTQMRK